MALVLIYNPHLNFDGKLTYSLFSLITQIVLLTGNIVFIQFRRVPIYWNEAHVPKKMQKPSYIPINTIIPKTESDVLNQSRKEILYKSFNHIFDHYTYMI